jgi:hypothetical protein
LDNYASQSSLYLAFQIDCRLIIRNKILFFRGKHLSKKREAAQSFGCEKLRVMRGTDKKFNLHFNLVNAPLVKPPVVVLHGGPGLPSDYLQPLEAISEGQANTFS